MIGRRQLRTAAILVLATGILAIGGTMPSPSMALSSVAPPPFLASWGVPGSKPGRLDAPRGISSGYLRPDISVAIADTGNNRAQTFSNLGEHQRVFGDPGQYQNMTDVAVGAYGDLWIVDKDANRVTSLGIPDCCRAITLTTINRPTSIAMGDEPNGKYISEYEYILDGVGHIEKYDFNGGFINIFGSQGSGPGQMFNAQGIAASPNGGLIYVADTGNNRVVEFDKDAHFIRSWGSFGTGDGQFDQPLGIAVDRNGNVYVADSGNDRIEIFDANGNYQSQFGSTGAGDGQFNKPRDLAFTQHSWKTNWLFVLDGGNNRVEVFGTMAVNASLSSKGTTTGGLLEDPRPVDSRLTRTIHPGGLAEFTLHLENDLEEQTKIDVQGDSGNGKFAVRYFYKGTDVTDEVTTEPGYAVAVDPGETEDLTLTVRALRGSSGKSFTSRLFASDPVGGVMDTVEARVRVT